MKAKIVTWGIVGSVACSCLVGCDRTVSREESSKVGSDGSVKTKEKTVTEKSDGTVTKSEETKKTEPVKP